MSKPLDLEVRRTPSQFRNLLEVRVRRLSRSKTKEQRLQALVEIREISEAAIKQHQ